MNLKKYILEKFAQIQVSFQSANVSRNAEVKLTLVSLNWHAKTQSVSLNNLGSCERTVHAESRIWLT